MKKNLELQGKEYWRSLDQLADTAQFKEFLHREFPEGASELPKGMSRRNFLTLMGASFAMAGLTACRRPVEKIIPYVVAPEEIIPGIPEYYATTMPFGTSAYGLVVESHEGRPTKIEGNEKHPSTLGRSNTFLQAAILGLYDPDRSQKVKNNGEEKLWKDFVAYWQNQFPLFMQTGGEGLAVLCEPFSSPTLMRFKKAFDKQFPKTNWVTWEPVSNENIYNGVKQATGAVFQPVYHFDKANVILSLDSDFLLNDHENISNAAGFVNGRKVNDVSDEMNRLYVAEANFSLTGGMADHRLRIPASLVADFTVALAQELQNSGIPVPFDAGSRVSGDAEIDRKFLLAVADDLAKNQGNSLVVAGKRQPAEVHALVCAINYALKNTGNCVEYFPLPDAQLSDETGFAQMVNQMRDGKVNTLVMLNCNPAYAASVDYNFISAMRHVPSTIHVSSHFDETAILSQWHIPQAHFLESWGDARAVDGTASIVQPLIEPLYNGKSVLEMLGLFINGKEINGYEAVRETWLGFLSKGNFEKNWIKVLHDGVVAESKLIPQIISVLTVSMNTNAVKPSLENLEVVFQESPAVYDGRFANNGWLQELPDAVTKLAWDNAAIMSKKTADALDVANEDLVVLSYRGSELVLPVWILPGQADFSVSLVLGYGRTSVGRIGNGVGFNTYRLRTSKALYMDTGLTVRKGRGTYPLANTQDHNSMEGRPIVREATLEKYREDAHFAPEMVEHPPLVSLWEERPYDTGYQWGMTIDLNSCTGCNACTIACQSENNIPVIGKEQVKNGREMHWLRMDRYFSGEINEPEMVYQPVACQHCENAPCEQVCPVAATVHDQEGLNVMTYNRCIGTRYCSNNCPFKVRRFNFFNYTKELPEIVKMAQNPDVTVRSRGVMEKCTFCVQRISEAKINTKREGRAIRDGEVRSACQQACPTDAIVFGNINDPDSLVSKMKKQDRNYEMLAELNIKPRTSYLAKLRNPNPDLKSA